MFGSFFILAARSPSRQGSFRKVVASHLALVGAVTLALMLQGKAGSPILLGHILLTTGIVEGALLVGWRLTQIPRSQALEFLLVSQLQPARLFLGEALVGLMLLSLVTISGLPILALLAAVGHLDPLDLVVLLAMPFTWGAVTGLTLTVWAYEPKAFRQIGEIGLMGLILVYLIVGVLAGENLRQWLDVFPEIWKIAIIRIFHGSHEYNPFGTMHCWMMNDIALAWSQVVAVQFVGVILLVALLWRASARLLGHFHERHYEPARDVKDENRPPVGDHPLAWWAVKRVSEYSGRINLWLAGGFCLLYAAYLVGEASWPAWMGRRIFQMCDGIGGVAALSAALIVLAAVPAAFQYGLWDSSTQDRCRRLELLLLTYLQPRDYWDAAFAAAWRRGRGYFVIALVLWLAALVGGRLSAGTMLASLATGILLWTLYFALGFRAFARSAQANGLGLLLTVGLPLGAWGLSRAGLPTLAGWLPPGMVYRAGTTPLAWPALLGAVLLAGLTILLARRSLSECDARLRQWYDQHHGSKVMS
jgi:hypothetical protein